MLLKCKCGKRKTVWHRWRVLERGEPKSLLKCLACGHKWKSRCKYVAKLDDHVERSRSGMTDDEILMRIKDKSLIVDSLGCFVLSMSIKGVKRLQIWEHERNGSSYRFVQVCSSSKKKKIAIHRLVWMSHFLQTVPDDMDVDHIKGRKIEYPDGIGNLRLLPVLVNRSRVEVPEGKPF